MKPLSLLALMMVAGCTLGPVPREATSTYDLGAPRTYSQSQPRIRPSLLVQDIGTPAWLDSTAIVYRLEYRDPGRQFVYANNRWASPPGALLVQKLRSRLAAASDGGIVNPRDSARADYALRIELEDFSQVFDSADKSRGVVLARASLIDGARRSVKAQKVFSVERGASGANAEAGITALAAASDELIDGITVWVAATLGAERK
jgi:cholesterol transport system auxiliary component